MGCDRVGVVDQYVLSMINGYAGNSELIDQIIDHVSNNYLFKGAIPLLFFWHFWASQRNSGNVL